MPFQTLTIQQAAQRLHMDAHELAQLVKRDEVPCIRRGDEMLFVRRDLDAWASHRLLNMSPDNMTTIHGAATRQQVDFEIHDRLIPRLFRPEWINPKLLSKTKPSVLRDMVALAAQTTLLYEDDVLLRGLEEREQQSSTAVGNGVAFLHMRYHDPLLCSDSFAVLGRTVRPIFAGAPDGQATDIFFLLCCQDNKLHLHALARLCAMSNNTTLLADLRTAATSQEMFAVLERTENTLLQSL